VAVKQISTSEIQKLGIENVGLDPSVLDLRSPEAISALLRRAAGFHCPCPPATLVNVVLDSLSALVDKDDLREPVTASLERLTSYGDLVEAEEIRSDRDQAMRLLYAAPPSFVVYEGLVFLVGISPDQISVLPHELEARIEYSAHIRRLRAAGNEKLSADLTSLGLISISLNSWLKTPTLMAANEFLARFDLKLIQAGPSGSISGLRILDAALPVDYYPGRWREPKSETGRVVGRRSRAYGADLWTYVLLEKGIPQKLVDLPQFELRWRACDEAWHLQSAVDAVEGHPQQFRVRSDVGGKKVVLDLFSPLPSWMTKKWDLVGEPVLSTGCLFSYAFPEATVAAEIKFLSDYFWLVRKS
jgi:hypothetical protein